MSALPQKMVIYTLSPKVSMQRLVQSDCGPLICVKNGLLAESPRSC